MAKECLYCEKNGTLKNSTICTTCKPIYEEKKRKICTTCKKLREWNEFTKMKNALYGIHAMCKSCRSDYDRIQMSKSEIFLKRVFSACIAHTKLRNMKGRDHTMKWTLEELEMKLKKQDYKCAVSGITMNLRNHSDWQLSPDRLDNIKGYSDENIQLVCYEFQLARDFHSSIEYVEFLCQIEEKPHPRLVEIMNGIFEEKEYTRHCLLGIWNCKDCKSFQKKQYRATVRGRLQQMIENSKHSTIDRNKRGRNHQYDVDFEYLLFLLQKQEGKCYYSGHNLEFSSGMKCVSLERINVKLGYIKGNVCLILQCLNTMDQSINKSVASLKMENQGSGGWTKDKIAFLRNFRKEEEAKKIVASSNMKEITNTSQYK